MAAAPSFGTSSTDEGAAPPWYKNKTFLIVGGLGLAALVFYYFYSQQSATGSTSTVTTTPSTGDASSTDSNVLSTLDTLSSNDTAILSALQNGSGQSGASGTGELDNPTLGALGSTVYSPITSGNYSYTPIEFPVGTTLGAAATSIFGNNPDAMGTIQSYNPSVGTGNLPSSTQVGGQVLLIPSSSSAPTETLASLAPTTDVTPLSTT